MILKKELSEDTMKYSIKPEFTPFVVYNICISFIITTIVTAILSIVALIFQPLFIVPIVILGILLFGYGSVNRFVAYKKESYSLSSKEFIQKGGSIFSETQTELTFKNVTNIIHVKPFIEYFLFKTSHIAVESAGSSTTEIQLRFIKDGDDIYQKILSQLRTEFKLNEKAKIVEHPSKIGILVDNVKQLILGLVTFTVIIISSFSGLAALSQVVESSTPAIIIASAVVVFILFIVFVQTILKILDQYYRTYTLSDSAAMYKEGFLTKVEQIIPFENVSDINTEQNILDRIIGTTTIIISCQGQSQNIAFSYVPKAETVIEYLKKQIEPFKEKQLNAKIHKKESKKEIKKEVKSVKKTKVSFSEQTFGMNKIRALVGPLVLIPFIIVPPIIFLIIYGLIVAVLRSFFTTYTIEKKNMRSSFDFVQKKVVTFSADKITGVHIKINPIDRVFKTCTVHFWSIGSAVPLQFTHIPLEKGKQILADLGFTGTKSTNEFKPSVSPKSFVTRFFPLTCLLVVGIIIIPFNYFIGGFISLMLAVIGIMVFLRELLYYSRAKIENFPTYTKFVKGFIFYKESYAYDEQVKGFTVIQYPFTKKGTLSLNVAGESFRDPNDQRGSPVSHVIKMPYVRDCLSHPLIPKQTKLLLDVKPMIPNVFLMAIYVITIPLIPFLVIGRRFTTFEIHTKQTIMKKGVLYKIQKHILDSKLDYVAKNTGMINKIVKNGNVAIHTTGSSTTEMILYDIKEYNEVYTLIQKKYKK